MKRQHRVLWTKGMFLSPQHFQAQDQYFENQVIFRNEIARYENWGVTDLEIDHDSVEVGEFRIIRCTAVMADGLAVGFGGAEPGPKGSRFEKHFPAKLDELDVFLAVPESQINGRNISGTDGPELRFVQDDVSFIDEYDGEEELLEVARPNLLVVFGSAPPGLRTIKVARITRAGGPPQLDPAFIPPCLSIGVSEELMERILPRLVSALKLVQSKLQGARGERNEYLAEFTELDIQHFWVLDIVNRALPELNHLHTISRPKPKKTEEPDVGAEGKSDNKRTTMTAAPRTRGGIHPEELYRVLLRLAGGLCTFSTEVNPLDLPAYDHENLGCCFKEITDKIELMLKSIAFPPAKFSAIPLSALGNGEWKSQEEIDKVFFRPGNRFYLALRVDAKCDLVRFAEIDKRVRLSGGNLHKELWIRAMEGAELDGEDRQPRGLPGRAGSKYFRIKPGSLEWSDVEETQEVHISIRPGATDPSVDKFEVEMFVLLQERT